MESPQQGSPSSLPGVSGTNYSSAMKPIRANPKPIALQILNWVTIERLRSWLHLPTRARKPYYSSFLDGLISINRRPEKLAFLLRRPWPAF